MFMAHLKFSLNFKYYFNREKMYQKKIHMKIEENG